MSEIFRPHSEKMMEAAHAELPHEHKLEEPLTRAIVWRMYSMDEPVFADVIGSKKVDLARVSYRQPILANETGKVGSDVSMNHVYVRYEQFRSLQIKYQQLLDTQNGSFGSQEPEDNPIIQS